MVHEGAAPAYQHQHVTGPDRATAGLEPAVVVFGRRLLRPPSHAVRDERGKPRRRVVGLLALHRQCPGLRRLPLLRRDGRPQLDPAAGTRAMHLVADGHRLGSDARARLGPGEHGIDRGEHRPGRAKGFRQGERLPRPVGGLGPALESPMGGGQRTGVGALEAEDRLLLVADRKEGARRGAGAFAREELFRQRRDHRPLRGAGVLRLVDQQVVEAAVELVEHPRCDACTGEQTAADGDLIAVVEHGIALFLGPVEAEMAGRDLDKGGAALGHAGGVPALDDRADPLLL